MVSVTPVNCRVKHDPPRTYGDCLRCCIATVMDLDAERVPHFADMGATAQEALASARRWLGERRLTIAGFAFPGDESLDALMAWMGEMNPTVTWLLFGNTGPQGGDHVVVCQGGAVVHDPAWVKSSIKQPGSGGQWEIWLICRV